MVKAPPDYTFPAFKLDPGDTRKVALNLFRECANFWRANETYGAGEYIRPTRATGFSYQCTTAGTSGAREPVWPISLGATIPDGSVVWTASAALTNGLQTIQSPTAASDPVGLTISDVSVSEAVLILATYSAPGSVPGQSFDAKFTFTLDGVSRVVRQRVEIRKR